MSGLREQLVVLAQQADKVIGRCTNEEQTKLYLVLPFLRLLGYDDRDPEQVIPEYHADFSEQYRNRVDFTLMVGGEPAIAIECKSVGAELKDERGQLRSYFNALSGSRVGALTNGIEYEFFINSITPNKMDEEPFLSLDLRSFSDGSARNDAVDVLELLRRDRFDASAIVDRARQSLLQSQLAQLFGQELRSPSDEFCKHFLLHAGLRNVRKSAMDTYRGVVKAAIMEALAKQIWDRLQLQHQLQAADRAEESSSPAVETTERELYIFSYCQRRLAYLVRDPQLFQEVEKLGYRDHASKFVVYYDMSWKGRLFDFYENDDGRDCFVFSNDMGEIVTSDLSEIDHPLLAIFQQRVREINGIV